MTEGSLHELMTARRRGTHLLVGLGVAAAFAALVQMADWLDTSGRAAGIRPSTGLSLALLLGVVGLTSFVVAALVQDLERREEAERRVAANQTDALTGLPNRVRLNACVAARLTESAGTVAVLWCDLDHFKVVNDAFGHRGGDQVLVEAGRRLSQSLQADTLLARISGDEFVAVIHDPPANVTRVAERLIAALNTPITLDNGRTISASLSVGIAVAAGGSDPEVLLRNADAALRRAKELGSARWHMFDDELRIRVDERIAIETDVRPALVDGAISCLYQPEIYITTGDLFGLEALARWHHPRRGQIPPDRFVPVLEEMGVADLLFDRVLRSSLTAQANWAKHLGFHPALAVNLSAVQLSDPMLPGKVAMALARVGAPADTLWLEVTETGLAGEASSDVLLELHDLGVHLAIDDFGTGWSSLSRLASFPWDLLKIDKSFVQALATSEVATQVVRSTIAMAHALGILTTAEGVETPEQLERLAELGCDVAQGFLIARPGVADDALCWMREQGSTGDLALLV